MLYFYMQCSKYKKKHIAVDLHNLLSRESMLEKQVNNIVELRRSLSRKLLGRDTLLHQLYTARQLARHQLHKGVVMPCKQLAVLLFVGDTCNTPTQQMAVVVLCTMINQHTCTSRGSRYCCAL